MRFANTESFTDYMASGTRVPPLMKYRGDESDQISEYVFLGLRKTEGIDLNHFSSIFKKDFWDIYSDETEKLIERGLLERSGSRLRLTRLGLDLSNQVFIEYI
jgi:oxygen-independent coproporphyrinogen-3 oxidase